MRSRDLVRPLALLCIALAVGCTDGSTAVVPTEVNLDIVHPSSDPSLGFSIDRVDYRVTCDGSAPGSLPLPPADTTGTPYAFDDSVDTSGAFEVVDTRDPPVWQATMDLPPGDCTITMLVYEGDEVMCVGTETLTIVPGESTKFDIVLLCLLSVDTPGGAFEADVSIDLVVGNMCPRLYSLMAIPRTVDIAAVPPRTRIEYRSRDEDGTCGNNCRPEVCTNDIPPICTPSVYNPADPRCNPALGGDPASLACQDGTASGLVCTLTATPTATAVPGGDFVSPLDGTTLVGPVVAVNLQDVLLDGTGLVAPGADILYECDPAIPGSVTVDLVCADGDPFCDRVETMTVICPGQNFCDSDPIDCSAPSECTAEGLCDAFCDPADLANCANPGNRCPGQGDPLPSGTACTTGGTVCDGGGACVECVDGSQCDSTPLDCREPAECSGNVCQPRAFSPVGTPCSNGECDAAGVCQFVPIDPPADTRPITLGCTSGVASGVLLAPFDLTVDPPAIVSGVGINAAVDGVARVPEALLDDLALAVPGGVSRIEILGLQASVHLRSGGAGADVVLVPETIAFNCAADGAPCDPLNDQPGGENTDCLPLSTTNTCGTFVEVPTSADCSPGGACDALGKLGDQCAANAACVTGDVGIPLQAQNGAFSVDLSGDMRFGWDDASTGATVNPDGTWALPPAVFADPLGPNGMRIRAGALSVAVECTMGVDSADPLWGVGIVGQSSPTPDDLLVTFPIQVP